MSKLSGLNKKDKIRGFIDKSTNYQSGKNKSKSRVITFTIPDKYLDLMNDIAKKDMFSRSELIRAAIVSFSRLPKEEREQFYTEIYNNINT